MPPKARFFFNRREGGIASTVLISPAPLSVASAALAYSRFANTSDSISQLQAFSSKEVATATLGGKGATDLDESQWYSRYLRSAEKQPASMAEILKVGRDVAARVVVQGKVQKKILAGGDPYRCAHATLGCEIIWITVGRIPPGDEGIGVKPMIHLFVKTASPVTASEARIIM